MYLPQLCLYLSGEFYRVITRGIEDDKTGKDQRRIG